MAVAVAVVMLLREPTLFQVGDVSPERAWKEPVNLTARGGGFLATSLPNACIQNPLQPTRAYLCHPYNPNLLIFQSQVYP